MKNQSDQNRFVLSIARRIQIAMVLILLSVILTLGVLTYQFFVGSPSVSMAQQYVANYTTKKDIPAPKNEWMQENMFKFYPKGDLKDTTK